MTMGRWKKSKSFAPPALKGFKKKEESAPVFNFSGHLIDALDTERVPDKDQFGGAGHFNEAFADLDEYGFTLKRRDTSGDIIFKSAETVTHHQGEPNVDSFSDLNAFGNITTAHEVERYDSALEVSEDRETGEKSVVYEVHNNVGPSGGEKTEVRSNAVGTSGVKNPDVEKGNSDSKEAVSESKQDVTSDSVLSVDSKYSMDLDDLYKETHLPEREPPPPRKNKKKPKRKESKLDKKRKANDVVDKNAESPFVRSFRPASVVSASEDTPTDKNQSQTDHNQLVSNSNQSVMDQNQSVDQSESEISHISDSRLSDLPQVHQNGGFVPKDPKEENNNNSNVAVPYNPNHINIEIARLDDDLMPITGVPANQIFQSNVPKLSAHKLAILGGSTYRSSKYKRGNPVERRMIRNSLRDSKEFRKIQREELNRVINPSPVDVVPAWAKRKSEDKTLKYSLIGVLIFLAVAAICVPLMWLYGGSDDDTTTELPPGGNFTTAPPMNVTTTS